MVGEPKLPTQSVKLQQTSPQTTTGSFQFSMQINQPSLIAAQCGATYISPFIGRLDINSTSGVQLIKEMVTICNNYNFKSQILAASMRNAIYVKEASLAGAHIATVPPNVLDDMMNCELSKGALKGFLDEWNKIYPGKNMLGDDVE